MSFLDSRIRVVAFTSCVSLGFLLLNVKEMHSAPEEPRPVATIDLRAYLGAQRGNISDKKRVPAKVITMGDQIQFIDGSLIAISLVKENASLALSRRDDLAGGRYSFETSFVDFPTGKIRAERTWSSATVEMGLLPLRGGAFLVRASNIITTYSKKLQTLNSVTLPVGSTIYLPRVVVPSDGDKIYIVTMDKPEYHRDEVTILDAATLEILESFQVRSHFADAASDSFFAYTWQNDRGVNIAAITRPKGDPTTLYSNENLGCSMSPTFLGTDVLLLFGRCGNGSGNVLALALDGRQLFRREFDNENPAVIVSQNGNRFAVVLSKFGGGGFDRPQHVSRSRVLVFDKDRQDCLLEIQLSSGKSGWASGVALSPDGSRLVVLTNGILRGYRISLPGSP